MVKSNIHTYRKGTRGCLSTKFYDNPFVFNVFTTLETIVNFDLLVYYVECQNVSTTNFNLQKGKFCVLSLGMYINLSAIVLSLQIPDIHSCLSRFLNWLLNIFPYDRGGGWT